MIRHAVQDGDEKVHHRTGIRTKPLEFPVRNLHNILAPDGTRHTGDSSLLDPLVDIPRNHGKGFYQPEFLPLFEVGVFPNLLEECFSEGPVPLPVCHRYPPASFGHHGLQILGTHHSAESPTPKGGDPVDIGHGKGNPVFAGLTDAEHAGGSSKGPPERLTGLFDTLPPQRACIADLHSMVLDLQEYGAIRLSLDHHMIVSCVLKHAPEVYPACPGPSHRAARGQPGHTVNPGAGRDVRAHEGSGTQDHGIFR